MKCITFLLFTLYSFSVFSHPHVFIDVKTKLISVKGGELEVQIEWLFDGMTSQSLLEEFDKNMNKKIDPTESSYLVKNFKENISKYNYMTELVLNKSKKKTKFNVIKQSFSTKPIVYDGMKFTGLIYRYSIKKKVGKNKLSFSLTFYDPSSYSELAPVGKMEIAPGISILSNRLIKVKSRQVISLGAF